MAERNKRRRDTDTDTAAGAPPRSRSFWSGTITFGLVSIPVDLYTAHRPGRTSLRMLSPEGTPLRRKYFPAEGDRELASSDLVRGFEVEPGEHVVVTDGELESLEPRRSRDIDLTRFVPVDEIDPMMFERGYFLAPSGESTKAYRLLAAVMEDSGRAGIATFVMRGKEYLVAILAADGVLRAETLRFADEVRTAEGVGLPEPVKAPAAAVAKATKAIGALAASKLDEEALEDPWGEAMRALAEKKRRRGEGVVEVPEEVAAEEAGADIVDLMAILKQSLGATGGSGRAGASGRKPARQARPRSRSTTRSTGGRRASSRRAAK
jgi:DNA end-binding protein Ku